MKSKLENICKREIHRLLRGMIAAIGLVITVVAAIIVFPVYLLSEKRDASLRESHDQ